MSEWKGVTEDDIEEIKADIEDANCGIDPTAVDDLIDKVAWLGTEVLQMSAEISSLEGTINEMQKEIALVMTELDLD
tara:strand:+ start:14796 stop:15026 length:231 start_codon:yes stop_codon:yes gene_type:complete